jgi:hypothetical protein
MRNFRNRACGWSLVLVSLWAVPASAQNEVLSQFYGSGVHNYWDRDYDAAMTELSAAIDGGSQDPRAFYYRGLAHLKRGNSYAAQADLQKGAALESADVDQFYPVGKSLERLQGAERVKLERYRAIARAQARQRQVTRDAARYEQRRRAEAQVLRAVPLAPPPAPLLPAPLPPAPADAGPPAAQPPVAKPAEPSPFDDKPTPKPPTPEPPAAGDPFGDAADTEAADTDAAMPEEAPAGAAEGDAKEVDPFGDTP